MRLLAALMLSLTVGSVAHAQSQQQCEALFKPLEAKFETMPKLDDEDKPTPQTCARGKDVIKAYEDYTAKADKMNCAFAYLNGQKIGGKAERADLLKDMKQAYKEKCR